MMSEAERAKVREYVRGRPDATVKAVEWLLGREMDALEIVETALIMTEVKAEAKPGASGAEKTEASAHCRLEIDFTLTPDGRGYDCRVRSRISADSLPTSAGLRLAYDSSVLRRAVSMFREEIRVRLVGGDMQRCLSKAEIAERIGGGSAK